MYPVIWEIVILEQEKTDRQRLEYRQFGSTFWITIRKREREESDVLY